MPAAQELPRLICRCGRDYGPAITLWRCECSGTLDLAPGSAVFAPHEQDRTMWRYARSMHGLELLPWKSVTLGEGGTPLVHTTLDGTNVALKVEYMSPTGSFKDRGAVVLVATALALGAQHLVADSSGNAGTALAAYAARAGLHAEIFVPEGTSEKKLLQIQGHGAKVVVVAGDRGDTADAAARRVEEAGAFYASHVYNPFFHEGTKTYGYELYEQLGRVVPATLIIPAGNGTLLLGVYKAFRELMASGQTDRMPALIAVQAANCAPLASAFVGRGPATVQALPTLAEGIAIAAPARAEEMLESLRATSGCVVTVTESEIVTAHAALAAQGLWVEPTAAAPFAAARQLRESESPYLEGLVVAPLSGSGLKASLPVSAADVR